MQQYPGTVCVCQTQSRMKSPENGKIPMVPATFTLPASLLMLLCGQANHLNHGLFATQNANYGLGQFSYHCRRVSFLLLCSSIMAVLNSEPVGTEPGLLRLGWLQDCCCWCGCMNSVTFLELKVFLACLKTLLLTGQELWTNWIFPGIQFWWEIPGPVNNLIKKQRDHKQCIAKPMRALFIDTSADSKCCFKSWATMQRGGWQRHFIIHSLVCFYWLRLSNSCSVSVPPINTNFLDE